MPREDARTKGRRLLSEHRVMIVRVLPTSVLAVVRGDGGELYQVSWDRRQGWRCTCAALGQCSHGFAVASVVLVEQSPGGWVDLGALLTRGNGGTFHDREQRLAGMVADPSERGRPPHERGARIRQEVSA